ncbi:hypothetical protein MPH_08793 [Macrophomina phaseolina MS6]|uniref:N-acetyltransferase domain-containing protein n=1 Tax=Macrophomina phaseolina (strain MS6) TaxID=1126212 RepID=K2QWD4_MACPH|nr:hypothetical protein MPH_08793 [Macrophomina phaseolina MS6]
MVARPLGQIVPSTEPAQPEHQTFHGRYVTLRPLKASDADTLFPLLSGDANAWLYDYMPYGPFSADDKQAFQSFVAEQSASTDPLFFAVVVKPFPSSASSSGDAEGQEGKALGWCSLLRITPAHRVVEVGHLLFSSLLQRTPAATEAIYLLARYVFEVLQYRRLEWKCNDLNAPSKRAAARLGFRFEGIFRKHLVVKGRNRDTAWFSIVDEEWSGGVGKALERWLGEDNFGEKGEQKKRLEDLRAELLAG